MEYRCKHCGWTGTWDALILETLCPVCRGETRAVRPGEDEPVQAAQPVPPVATGSPGL